MSKVLLISNIPHGKILAFSKNKKSAIQIREFIKGLGITRDYRKDLLKGRLSEGRWGYTTTKGDEIMVSYFLTKNKIFLQIIFFSDKEEERVIENIIKYFKK